MTNPTGTQHVDFWFDPVCPWAWMASRWMMQVQKVRDVSVTWRQMSLSVLNEGRALDPDYADLMQRAWLPARMVAAARLEHGEQIVKPLYDAIGSRVHLQDRRDEDPRGLLGEALVELGLEPALLERAEPVRGDEVDLVLRQSHSAAQDLVGDDVGTPVIGVGEVGFFGPVLSPAPKAEAAGKLWDGCLLVAQTDGFFELKRSRDRDPIFD